LLALGNDFLSEDFKDQKSKRKMTNENAKVTDHRSRPRKLTSFKRGVNESRLINTQLQLGSNTHAMPAMYAKEHTPSLARFA